jgi:hypothetical protein
MTPLWIICAIQVLAAMGVVSFVRNGRRSALRLAGLCAVVCLAPLMLLGMTPSAYMVAALAAFPALLVWLAAIVQPRVVRPRPVRWYGMAVLVPAIAASVIQLHWIANCHEVTFVVPDGFKGTITLVKDSVGGVDLEETEYTVRVPPGAELPIRDDRFFFRCYSAAVRSTSGAVLPFRDGGVQPGGPVALPGGGEWSSTEFDGTRHRWIVE